MRLDRYPALAAAVVFALSTIGLVPTPAQAVTPATPIKTADPLPTWQTNGIVWTMEHVGGVVYVGGNFTSVRPPGSAKGQNEVPRNNMAAFDAATGALLPFSHTFTAPTFAYNPATT